MTVLERAVVAQRVARPPIQAEGGGASPTSRLHFTEATIAEVNPLLAQEHYLGPMKGGRHIYAGWVDDEMVACQVYRHPTSRHMPSDGSWLELSRWCLTPAAGPNAGSKMQGWATRHLRREHPHLTTILSYSDPSAGHLGTLYRASGWWWRPAWQRLCPPPSEGGDWGNGKGKAAVKDRWAISLRDDARWGDVGGPLAVKDNAALRAYLLSTEWRVRTSRWQSNLWAEGRALNLLPIMVPKS